MADSKRTLYVGGLADDVNSGLLKSAFSPFGDIIDINLPMDYSTQKHKGFAFIEFQLPEDAADAIDNMDNGEILGRTIRVNLAKPNRYRESANKPVWADDEYLRETTGSGVSLDQQQQHTATVDVSPAGEGSSGSDEEDEGG